MSLDWNAEKVVGINWDDEVSAGNVSNFAWMLMAIGVGSVKESNVGEVLTRIKIWEALHGPMRYHYDDDTKVKTSIYNDFEFVRSMIGYSTNVTTQTHAQWVKRVVTQRVVDFQKQYEEAI